MKRLGPPSMLFSGIGRCPVALRRELVIPISIFRSISVCVYIYILNYLFLFIFMITVQVRDEKPCPLVFGFHQQLIDSDDEDPQACLQTQRVFN